MSIRMKTFLFLEALLFVWLIFQLTNNLFLIFLLFVGLFLLIRKKPLTKGKNSRNKTLAVFFLLFSVLSTQAAWSMILVAVLFLLFPFNNGKEALFNFQSRKPPWKQKEFFSVDSLKETEKYPRLNKTKWIGQDYIGTEDFVWEDVNYTKFMGETIIDLGNTILSNKENVIIIRKGFGNTKILVPSEVGVTVNYTSLIGTFTTENETHQLKNEQIKYVEETYNEKPRKLHIIINVFVGDLEVISL